MPTIFTHVPGSTPPTANYHIMVPALCKLVVIGSSAVPDFSDLLYPAETHGISALTLIDSARAAATDPEALQLFDELKLTHNSCTPSEWFQILGHIVEESSRELMASKYSAPRSAFWQHPPESKIVVEDSTGSLVCKTGDFPMDTIAWDISLDYGEALEVKKSVEGVLPYNGLKKKHTRLINKLNILEQFKALSQTHSGKRSYVGVFTLLERLEDAEAGLSLLTQRSLNIDIIARDTVSCWYRDVL